MRLRLGLVGCAATAGVALAGATSAGGVPGAGNPVSARGASYPFHVYVAANCQGHALRPRAIILTCADATARLDRIAYARYGGARATGHGRLRIDDCRPNCAAGRFRAARVSLALSRVVRCGDRLHYYTRIVVTAVGRRPKAVPRRLRVPLDPGGSGCLVSTT